MKKEYSLHELAKAIYTVNRHAKAAPQPKQLYDLKKTAIEKLMEQNKVKIIGMQFSNNPKKSVQHSTLLVQIDDYFFHTIPTKQSMTDIPHLGKMNFHYRNPKTYMALSTARRILYDFLDIQPSKSKQKKSSFYSPSFLGRWDGHPEQKQWRKKY